MQYDEIDYYHEAKKYDVDNWCCLYCEDSEDGCLCPTCKCSKCYWYGYEGGEGYCELASLTKEKYDKFSDKKVHNFCRCNEKSVFCQIDNSELMWVPLSVINKDNFVKQWFVDKKRLS